MKGPTYLSFQARSFACESCGGTRVAPESGRTRELAEALAAFEAAHAHCSGWDERPAGPTYNDRPDLEARLAAAAILAVAVRRLERLRNPPPNRRPDKFDRYRSLHDEIAHAQEAIVKALAGWDREQTTGRLRMLERQAELLERCGNPAVRAAVIFASRFCSEQHLSVEVQARLAYLLSTALIDVRYEGQEAAVRARVKAIFDRSAPGCPAPLPEKAEGKALEVAPGDWLVLVPGKKRRQLVAHVKSDEALEELLARVDHLHATAVLVAHAAVRP